MVKPTLSQKIAYNSITATQLMDKICNVYVIVNMYVDNLLRRGDTSTKFRAFNLVHRGANIYF